MSLNTNIRDAKTCKQGLDALKNMTVNGKTKQTNKQTDNTHPLSHYKSHELCKFQIIPNNSFQSKRKTKPFQEELEELRLL